MVWEAAYIHSPQAANRVKVTLRFQANAAGLTQANNAKPEAPKPESSTVLSNATSEPSMNLQKAQLSSGLPLFFISSILGYGNNYLRLVLVLQHFLLLKTKSMSTLTTPVKPQSCFILGNFNWWINFMSPFWMLVVGFEDEYKEFEKLIQEDLKEVDNRLEEEEIGVISLTWFCNFMMWFDAAEMIEEAESVEQKVYWEKVEMMKKKKLELKAARSGRRSKEPEVRGKLQSVSLWV
ncbi:hypothetical protein AAG906_019521 [Vitis piasezkii]